MSIARPITSDSLGIPKTMGLEINCHIFAYIQTPYILIVSQLIGEMLQIHVF